MKWYAMEDATCKLTIILIGESGVGKTSFLNRFINNIFKEKHSQTVIDLKTSLIEMDGKPIKLDIWDTAGQERFRSIGKEYYRKADGIILMYDVTKVDTFYEMSNWLSEMRRHNDKAVTLIVGNKNENPSKKCVGVEMVRRFAEQEGLEFLEASAMSGNNIHEVFTMLVKRILRLQQYLLPANASQERENKDIIHLKKPESNKSRCCSK